ncbi:SKAP protein, partial [Dasyornis broadbenti]|nr:SKAP protein [Dasyornis broadbenti]
GRPSRIPLLSRLHCPEPSAEVQTTSPAKRKCVSDTSEPGFSSVTRFNFASNIPADGVLKAANQRLPKSDKKVGPVSKKRATRCLLSRYQLEAALKNKDELVETLKQQLARAEGAQQELKKENARLVQEVGKIKKVDDACIRILESTSMNPGKEFTLCLHSVIFPLTLQMLTEKVMEEFMLFFHTVAKEKETLEAVMANWKSAQDEKLHALEKHAYIRAQIKEWTAILEVLQKRLAM